MPERRFRDMRLTEDEVDARLKAYCKRTHELMWKYPDGIRYSFTLTGHVRAKRLLPLWREWSIERERLWFALIGLGLDIEGDTRDMSRAEMRRRIENESKRSLQALFVLQEVTRA